MSYPKRGLSVDIGNDKIKIAEFTRSKDKVKVKNVMIVDTPQNCINDGQVTDAAKLGETISAALKENKTKTKNVLFTVSSSKVITREVDLPDLPKKKLDTLIQMNAEEYFPVNLNEYTIDYNVQEQLDDGDEKQVRVNIIAALTILVESYAELATVAGLKIVGIDYSGNSIVNFAKHIKEEHTYMLLDLGSDSTMVTIMAHGKVRFNRNLVYGTKVISNSIQNHFGVEYNEAMKISMDQELLTHAPEGNDFLSNDVSAALNQILNGVSRLVDYYVSRNKDGIDRIILVGGGTSIKGIDSYISDYFNINTRILSIDDIEIDAEDDFSQNIVFFANAVGAVYSEVNLLPLSITSAGKEKASRRLRFMLIALLVALGAVLVYLPYSELKKLEAERDALLAEVIEKRTVQPILDEYEKAMAEVAFYEGVVSISTSTTEVLVQIFEAMEDIIPSEVSYLTLNNTEEGLLISCVASKKLDVVHFISTLKELSLGEHSVFSNVHVPNVATIFDEENQEEVDYITFSVICKYNKKGAR